MATPKRLQFRALCGKTPASPKECIAIVSCNFEAFLGPGLAFRSSAFKLRGPTAILFISRDTCSDSIAKLFRTCFYGLSHKYRAIRCKMGYRTDVSV